MFQNNENDDLVLRSSVDSIAGAIEFAESIYEDCPVNVIVDATEVYNSFYVEHLASYEVLPNQVLVLILSEYEITVNEQLIQDILNNEVKDEYNYYIAIQYA